MERNEEIRVIEEGIQAHKDHKWVSKINYYTPVEILEYDRICKICGRLEHVIQTRASDSFDVIYKKFYKGVK